MTYAELEILLGYLTKPNRQLVEAAYLLAKELHEGQCRHSGEAYITHPTSVAAICTQWKLDAQAICAALLHDTLEDCGIDKSLIQNQFGQTVADLVDGLTKLDNVEFNSREEKQAENFRKMLLAMAVDVRVILIKLADRTHNMRTLDASPREKWQRIATETQEIYAPIAHRLGLNATYRELQDLCLRYLKPWRYAAITKALAQARKASGNLLDNGLEQLQAAFAKSKIKAQISGREKTLFSIYRKMSDKHMQFEDIKDLFGFRIVVPSLMDCYSTIGVLHQIYKPVPGRFKDHIAIPKVNGYQSLHTTLTGPSGVTIEFQVRTEQMHMIAESGVAAHWLYKTKSRKSKSNLSATDKNSDVAQTLGSQWLQSLIDIQNETQNASEFWDHVKVDLFPDAVYVFTPKNKIFSLPRGATLVDFAYAVHTNIGDRCMSAKVNGELVPLRQELKNGDKVEIITAPVSSPNPSWLSFVRTGRAKSRIRHFLKTETHQAATSTGEKLLVQALRILGYAQPEPTDPLWGRVLRFSGNATVTELFTDIGLGKRMAPVLAKHFAKLLSDKGIKPDTSLGRTQHPNDTSQDPQVLFIEADAVSEYPMASCCHPVFGDAVMAYLGHGEGLIIHREGCKTAQKLQGKNAHRVMPAHWSDASHDLTNTRRYEVPISVLTREGQGVLAQVTSAIAAADANILGLKMGPVVDTTQLNVEDHAQQITTELIFQLSVRSLAHLQTILETVLRQDAVIKAQRLH